MTQKNPFLHGGIDRFYDQIDIDPSATPHCDWEKFKRDTTAMHDGHLGASIYAFYAPTMNNGEKFGTRSKPVWFRTYHFERFIRAHKERQQALDHTLVRQPPQQQ
jgi:hypothetical protein